MMENVAALQQSQIKHPEPGVSATRDISALAWGGAALQTLSLYGASVKPVI